MLSIPYDDKQTDTGTLGVAQEGQAAPAGNGLTVPRVARRFAFAVIFFLLIDLGLGWIITRTAGPSFDADYRFKNGTDITALSLYADHIKQAYKAKKSGQTVVAFLGASPAYGYRIKNAANTYPYAFEAAVNEKLSGRVAASKTTLRSAVRKSATAGAGISGEPVGGDGTVNEQSRARVKVYNLASNGQLIADQYYIARALIDSADAFVIQLNYHTFNPHDAARPHIRYADVPGKLGVAVTAADADKLGIAPTLDERANAALSRAASRLSFTFAERDFIASRLFGGPPKARFAELYPIITNTGMAADAGSDPAMTVPVGNTEAALPGDTGESAVPFDSLPPQKQLLIVKRVAGLYDFTIDPADSEVYFLKRLVSLLAEHKKKALFFVTPLNVEALDEYGIFNRDAYDANVEELHTICEVKGLRFADANSGSGVVPADEFFDISHTIDSGGMTCGSWIARIGKGYIWGQP